MVRHSVEERLWEEEWGYWVGGREFRSERVQQWEYYRETRVEDGSSEWGEWFQWQVGMGAEGSELVVVLVVDVHC